MESKFSTALLDKVKLEKRRAREERRRALLDTLLTALYESPVAVDEAIIFGSLISESKFHAMSDIDIAVEFSDITKKQAFDFRKNIMGKVSDKLDIQVFNFLPEKIKKEILSNHRILYKNE